MGSLQRCCGARASFEEAEQLCRDALAMNRKHLGPDHYQVAWVASNLADVLVDTREYVEAEALYQEALGIFKKRELATAIPEVQSVYEAWWTSTPSLAIRRNSPSIKRCPEALSAGGALARSTRLLLFDQPVRLTPSKPTWK
jgi:tetratricopeptide (TPR) repeat protein